jgi:hypothetical protein
VAASIVKREKTIMKDFVIYILAALFFIVFTSGVSLSQIKTAESRENAAGEKRRLKDWQTIDLTAEGIKFDLPPDWKYVGFDLTSKTVVADSVMLEWNTPDGKFVRIYRANLHKGFLRSKQAMLAEDYRREKDIFYNNLRYLYLGGAKGIAYDIKAEWEGEKRLTVYWKSFRNFDRKSQQLDVAVSGNINDERLVKTILESIEVQEN